VVIAGHSQGTVISVAVVMLIQPETRQRVALMTFGCVLDRLYARFYPRYFGPDLFTAVGATLQHPDSSPRWSNLWRHSDFLGGSMPHPAPLSAYPEPGGPAPIGVAGAAATAAVTGVGPAPRVGAVPEQPRPTVGPWNVLFTDPPFDVQPGSVLYPPAGRHSGFWLVPEFQQQVNSLFTQIR
jgi:hypothetical protein